MIDPEKITELFVGDGYSVLVSENRQPGVVLSGEFLHSLAPVLQAAYARALSISPGQSVDSIKELCERLRPVLKNYEQSKREWMASQPLAGDFRADQAELEKLRRMLDDWS